jgi:divalent metal cation (Fe/Co/Zn/Cd) transporter
VCIKGWTSAAVPSRAIGVLLAYPLSHSIVRSLITIAIIQIVWQSIKAVFTRMLDGVDPGLINEIRHALEHVQAVKKVTDVRARWLGHRLHAEVNVAVPSALSVADGHTVAKEVRHQLMHHLNYLSSVVVHVDPVEEAGEEFHRISQHTHDGLPLHSH